MKCYQQPPFREYVTQSLFFFSFLCLISEAYPAAILCSITSTYLLCKSPTKK